MKKVTLLSALLLLGTLCTLPLADGYAQVPTFKYNGAPNLPINRGQTATHRIFVNDAVDIADVRIAVHAKTVLYSSLRIELLSPEGSLVILKTAQGNATAWYGSLGTSDSYTLFRDGGVAFSATTAPNDMVFQPSSPLSLINGESGQGWWTLKIIDEPVFLGGAQPQRGTWFAWSLMFNKVIQEPELVLFDQTLVGSNLTPQISGRGPQGAIIPNWNNDLDNACTGGILTLGKNGDAFPFVITGVPGNIGDPIAPFVSPGRFEITIQVATNYPDGPITSAFTSDIAMYFGQAVENFAGMLPSPPATYPNPTIPAEWPTGPATTTDRLFPGPEDINGGVRLVACNGLTSLAPGDFGGMDVTIQDNALTPLVDATPCGGIVDPSAGICGDYTPEQPLSALAAGARAVNGLYYLTIYDTYGDDDASMKNASSASRYGQLRVLSLRLRYLVGGGNTPSPTLHQGIAGPLLGVPTPGLIDGAVLGYRTSVGNTIPPYTYHGITPTQIPSAREPILYFTNIQKLYQGNSIGYMHEELINTQTNSWSTVGNHGPLAWPGALDDNSFNPTNAGNSSYADVIQIADGSWKIRHKIVQARYDSDPTDNEATGPEFHVTPNTFAYYKDKVHAWNDFTNPTSSGLPIAAYLGTGTGIAIGFTLFQYPSTPIVSVDMLMDMLAGPSGPTPQSDWRITIWPADNGLTGAPGGNPVARSTTISTGEYIPGTQNWRTAPIYTVDAQGAPDLTSPGANLPPGTYFVTFDVMGQGSVPLFPYTYGQAPTLTDRILTYNFSDNFGPLGPAATLGSHLTYLSTDIASPPSVAWGNTTAPIMANYTGAMKLNMDHKNDFAVDYVTFDGTLGNESVSMPNAPFAPSFFVSSRTLQGGLPQDCNVMLKIFQGSTWQPGDYSSGTVVTLNPFQTLQVSLADWSPSSAGSYTVEALLSRAPQDYNLVNNMIKFDIFVSATGAVIVKGNNAGSGKVNDLKDLLANRGHNVTVVDANDASLAGLTGSTMFVVGDVNNASLVTEAVNNGNQVAFVNDNVIASVANADKVFQIERTESYDAGSVQTGVNLRQVSDSKPIDVEPLTIEFTSKEDLLSLLASQEVKMEDVQLITPTNEAIEAMQAEFASLIPAVKNSPYGDLKYIAEKNTGIVYVTPTLTKSTPKPVDPVATSFALEQNFPNPFNPSTTIAYTLTEEAQVTLRVLDVLGKEVASLVNDTKSAGSYTVVFNGSDGNGQVLPSGTYLYRIDVKTANGTSSSMTKSMTLSK